jgi:hypothetical protein
VERREERLGAAEEALGGGQVALRLGDYRVELAEDVL